MKVGEFITLETSSGTQYVAEIKRVLSILPVAPSGPLLVDKNKPIGEQLKKWREDRKIGQARIAELAEITKAQLSRIENGKSPRPHKPTVSKIIMALERFPEVAKDTTKE